MAAQEPFIKAAKELLGEDGCYPMIAYGTMQLSEAFRNVCRCNNLSYDTYNEVAKDIEKYVDDKKWKPYIDEARKYVDTIISASIHPCAFILDNKNLQEEYGVVRIGNNICCLITSAEADEYKMLKDDFLIAEVYKLIYKTFKLINKPIIPIKELFECLDDRIWKLFEDGITCTLNQVDGDWATQLVKKYQPKSVSEISMFVACLRPFFNSWRDNFITKEPYTTGSPYLDEVLISTNFYILFQENLMQYFEWLGVSPAESIGLIKKISKKKIHKEDFDSLEEKIKENWIKQTGSIDKFYETWNMIQDCMSYGFCISGNTKLKRNGNGKFKPTVEEMYNIRNDKEYAVKTGHRELHFKYRSCGYGKALSLYDNGIIYENEIKDIYFTGIKLTFKLTTEKGRVIICTQEHEIITPSGRKKLCELSIGDKIYISDGYQPRNKSYRLTKSYKPNYPLKGQCGFRKNPEDASVIFKTERAKHKKNKDSCEKCGCEYSASKYFELHHKDFNRLNNKKENYMWLCNSCHKIIHIENSRNKRFEKGLKTGVDVIHKIEKYKVENVYAIEMNDPAHNFVIDNGLIVGNCSAHAVATGVDALYGAYLKVNYPLEYYTVALSEYSGDMDRTKRLSNELDYFNITLLPIKFGKSLSQYTMDKENNTIYKGVASIKFCNSHIADELMELSKNTYDSFIELLDDITEKTSVNSKQLRILTGLDFFSDFGKNKYLLDIITLYNGVKKNQKTILPSIRTCKQLKKEKFDVYSQYGLSESLVKKYSDRETEKQYSAIDNVGLLNALVSELENNPMDVVEQCRFEMEYLEYVIYVNSDVSDNLYIIKDFKTFKDVYKPYITLRQLKTGEEVKTKVKDRRFFKQYPFGQFSVLSIKENDFVWKNKMKKIDDEWVEIDEQEMVLDSYKVVKNTVRSG